jgi:branched-chain amino acid transport system ATP-binding protein
MTVPSAVSVTDLSLSIGGAQILNGINLEIESNQILGIIGPNGAGKTTFFNLLSGIRAPTRGEIFLNGLNVTHLSPEKRAKSGLARTFQTSSVFSNLSVRENVRVAAQVTLGSSMNIMHRARYFKKAFAIADFALEQVGLSAMSQNFAGALSHGDKRRLEIAIVLASDAPVVMLDEPMAGMSVENIPELVEIIRSLTKDHQRTVLIVEHHMDVILGLANKIAVLNFGELLICDEPANVISNPIVQSAYLGAEL